MGIASWVLLGTLIGCATNWLLPGRFPGGIAATIFGGAAGAFLGGALFSLIADRGVSGFDAVSLLIAFCGAALLLLVMGKIGYAAPRTY